MSLGISRKIREAYRNICTLYVDGDDEIILIGFSRGAFTIQCLARLIYDVGLIESQWIDQELPRLFDLWTETKASDLTGNPTLINHCQTLERDHKLRNPGDKIKIKAFAAWDDVASLQKIVSSSVVKTLLHKAKSTVFRKKSEVPFAFIGDRLMPNIAKAYHALALDEHRVDFVAKILKGANKTQLKQCWFVGSHGDVGGGNDNPGLANISLCWMIWQLLGDLRFNAKSVWDHTSEGTILRVRQNPGGLRSIIGPEKYDSLVQHWKLRNLNGLHVKPHIREVGKTVIQNATKIPPPWSNETIHFSVRAFEVMLSDPKRNSKSAALKGFKSSWTASTPLTPSHAEQIPYWKGSIGGQEVKIFEDYAARYEERMLQRWLLADRGDWRDVVSEFEGTFNLQRDNRLEAETGISILEARSRH
jgi:hypothetical protein